MLHMRRVGPINALPAAQRNASADGAVQDLQGMASMGVKEMAAILSVGSQAGTTPTLNVKIQHGDEAGGGDMADISGAAFLEVGAALSFQTIYFQTTKRYVRVVATLAGTNPVYGCAVILLADKRQANP